MTTGIEYVDRVWPVVRGCSAKVSAGCRYCWAERFAQRQGRDFRRVELAGTDIISAPERWRQAGIIFVAPMGDLFDPAVPDEHIRRVFYAMKMAPRQRFLVLTKRSKRMRDLINSWQNWPHWVWRKNIALGVSVENQGTAEERLADLQATPCKLRWVSYEPALGAVDFRLSETQRCYCGEIKMNCDCPSIDWVVIGGESARPLSRARPVNVEWFYQTIQDCRRAGIPIYVKQMGSAYALSHGWRDPRGANPAGWAPALRVREHLRWPALGDR